MKRYYLCDVVADTETFPGSTSFRAAVQDVLNPDVDWSIHDCRPDSTQQAGKMMAVADVTPEQHSVLAAAAGVTAIPFEDSSGNPLTVSDPIGLIDQAKRQQIQTFFEANHIPMHGLTLTDPIYRILHRFMARCRIRQYLVENDYTELLDSTISSIPTAKRSAIRTKLESLGYTMDEINGTSTIRAALLSLISQDNVRV